MLSAQGQVDSARAQVGNAQENLGYTVLSADAPGQVTAVGAEPGEVVRAGQTIVELARQGGRDAVFDVPEGLIRTGPRDPVVEIALNDDPKVTATGRVREVAPQADPATRTFQFKVGLIDPPEAMQLGSTVTGRIRLAAPPGVEVPASALTESRRRPGGVGGRSARPDRVAAPGGGPALRRHERRRLGGTGAGRRRGDRRGARAAPGSEGPAFSEPAQ